MYWPGSGADSNEERYPGETISSVTQSYKTLHDVCIIAANPSQCDRLYWKLWQVKNDKAALDLIF